MDDFVGLMPCTSMFLLVFVGDVDLFTQKRPSTYFFQLRMVPVVMGTTRSKKEDKTKHIGCG
jgi:hypothetical protein